MTSFNNNRVLQREYMTHKRHVTSSPEKKAFISAYLDMITDEDEALLGATLAASSDNGYTFSDPVHLPITNPHGPALLKNGEILMVGNKIDAQCAIGTTVYATLLDKDCHVLCDPWRVSEAPCDNVSWCEPYAAEMPNGDAQRRYSRRHPRTKQIQKSLHRLPLALH